jgi:hypothetical protein
VNEGEKARVAELMATARTYFVPASEQWLAEIPGFSFTLWALAEWESAAKICLAGRILRWLRKEGH